jgi:hypothetical protein
MTQGSSEHQALVRDIHFAKIGRRALLSAKKKPLAYVERTVESQATTSSQWSSTLWASHHQKRVPKWSRWEEGEEGDRQAPRICSR